MILTINLSTGGPRPSIVLKKITDKDERDRFNAAREMVEKLVAGDVSALLPGVSLDLSKLLPTGAKLVLEAASWKRAGRGATVDGKVGDRRVRVILVVTDDGWRVVDVRPPTDTPPQQPEPHPSTSPSPQPSNTPGPKAMLTTSQCAGVQVARGAKAGPIPVLLVPGPDGVAGLTASVGTAAVAGATPVATSLVSRFAEIPGVTAYVLAKGDGSHWVGDRDATGPAVADAIDCLHKGGQKVAVVGVSTGGLAVRWALTGDRAKAVGMVATIGSPFGGAYAVDVARVLKDDDPGSLPKTDAAQARRDSLVLETAMADLAVCPNAGGPKQHTEPACRRLDTLAALAGGLGDSLRPNAVGSLPAWPSGLPVLQIAGTARVGQIDVGDGIATTASALADASRKATHTCLDTKVVASAPARCWNSDLAVLTEAADDAVGAVRAFVHPTAAAFVDKNTASVIENGKVGASITATRYGFSKAAFSADGRYLVAVGSGEIGVLDVDTGAHRSAACDCGEMAVVGRQAYVANGYSSRTINAYELPDLRPRPSGLGEFGKPGSFAGPKAAYGEQLIVAILEDAGASNGTPSLVAVGPGGARSKVVKLPEPSVPLDVTADPYDPTGPVIALTSSHVSACSFFGKASIVNFTAGTRKDVDGKAFGESAPDTESIDIADVHRGGDGRYYAAAHAGSCDDSLNPTETVPWSLWRLDGTRWASVDGGVKGPDRYFGPAGRLSVTLTSSTDGTLTWKHGSDSQSYGKNVTAIASPPGSAIVTDPSLAPPAGSKVTPPKPLLASPDGFGPLRIGAPLDKLVADGLLKNDKPAGTPGCLAYSGAGRLKGLVYVQQQGGSTLQAVSVSSAKFGTDAGLPPNATLDQVKKAYGSALHTERVLKQNEPVIHYYVAKGPNILLFQVYQDKVGGYLIGEKSAVDFYASLGGLC
ncbi:esterase/lipase family protein [Fodinicola acaciae]|uniref:esterase/lipase family protein n=1 Tax=Fodinicola acaciae TaxID=2681555 RepID=UPI0013D7C80C|nr:hypothetical protein [Fodinicola acaciae]